jgi:phosphoglycerate dehydrogenase-like enzyme
MTRVLLTTTSFQDTPGIHHEMLAKTGFEIVRERGPLTEARMLELAGQFDAYLCGDDALTRAVIAKSLPRLKVISKYGIGLDKIDVVAATDLKVPVLFTPGVNHTTVAEHTFALLLAAVRNLVVEANHTAAGRWTRITGTELYGKTLAIVGFGRIGKEVASRAHAFGLKLIGYGNYWDENFAHQYGIERIEDFADVLRRADIISLHTKLTPQTKHLINAANIGLLKPGAPPVARFAQRDHHPSHRLPHPRERPAPGQLRGGEPDTVPGGQEADRAGKSALIGGTPFRKPKYQ